MKPERMDEENRDKPRLIIIGAGISGITAGNHLMKAGFNDLVILEASNRTGGRIWSVDLGRFHVHFKNASCFTQLVYRVVLY